jgi:hypothetical protein
MRRALALALLLPCLALAQAYPSKPVRIIVPYPAGGIVDLMARAVGDGLGAKLGQPVIVEPRPGADASIGTDAVAKADPDGHTVLMATLALAVNPNLSKVPWHPVNDFEGRRAHRRGRERGSGHADARRQGSEIVHRARALAARADQLRQSRATARRRTSAPSCCRL